ncbi:MAG TPA: 5'-nucleotidase C-terminal domain-containing protein, partial [Gemmatimonadaceae bacterium]|nr:5'-nucleotidase C-terminal domain-containing protein [Gemmatimonadaceae bacterium]
MLVDAGDLLQGNPFLYVAARVRKQPVHPVAASMNVMRYDAAVIGNHEFNYGVPLLREVMGKAAFPFLAANVFDSTGRVFTAPYTIVTRAGVRVGIIGATTPGSMVWDRDNMRAAGLTVTDIVPAVRRAVADARRARADVIVVLLHSGLSGPASYDTVTTGLPSENVAARVPREIDGIDVVVYGHSHRELVDSTINGALLIQPRNWAASVGVATLTMERRDRRWRVVSRRGSSVAVAGHAESPQVLAASVSTHAASVAWATESVGRTAVAWTGDSARVADMPITDLITEIMRRETGADLAASAAFSLDAALPAGSITRAQLARLYPYDNTLRAVRVSGAAVRAFLEHSARYYRSLDANGNVPAAGIVDNAVPGYNFDVVSGVDYTIDLSRPPGQRITRLQFRGRSVQPTDSFTLAVNNYRQGGGGGFAMLAGAPVVYEKDVDIRQLVIDEVARVGEIDPRTYAARNWRLEPAIARAAAYAEQNRGRAREAGGSAPAGGAATGIPASRPPQPARASGASGEVQGRNVRVIAMSDFHGALAARPDASGRLQGGAVALSAAVRKAQAECTGDCVSVVVDAGDLFTGSPASDWAAGRPTVSVMNGLDIAAGAIGNHEFDFGQDTLRARLRDLRHAILGVNVRGADGQVPAWLRSDTVVQRGAVKIGIVGAAGTHTPTSTKLRNVRTLRFVDPAPLISARVRALRAAGAQIVVGIIHDGVRCERDRPDDCRGGGLDVARALTDRPDVFV